jgi:hypothetical protein
MGFGLFLTVVTSFILLVELVTSPALSVGVVAWWCAATVGEAAHVFWSARSPRRAGWLSWALFAAAVILMIENALVVIHDPTARVVFAGSAAVGALWLAAGRATTLGVGAWASRRPWRGAALVAMAWLPLEAPAALTAWRATP